MSAGTPIEINIETNIETQIYDQTSIFYRYGYYTNNYSSCDFLIARTCVHCFILIFGILLGITMIWALDHYIFGYY